MCWGVEWWLFGPISTPAMLDFVQVSLRGIFACADRETPQNMKTSWKTPTSHQNIVLMQSIFMKEWTGVITIFSREYNRTILEMVQYWDHVENYILPTFTFFWQNLSFFSVFLKKSLILGDLTSFFPISFYRYRYLRCFAKEWYSSNSPQDISSSCNRSGKTCLHKKTGWLYKSGLDLVS